MRSYNDHRAAGRQARNEARDAGRPIAWAEPSRGWILHAYHPSAGVWSAALCGLVPTVRSGWMGDRPEPHTADSGDWVRNCTGCVVRALNMGRAGG